MTPQELEAYDAMMADRDRWKAAHDNPVELKRIIAARPDLKDRAPMVEKLMTERNRAQGWSALQHEKIKRLEKAGIEIIEAARRSLPRPHPAIERNATLFIPSEND
jgi:hypothetical protein